MLTSNSVSGKTAEYTGQAICSRYGNVADEVIR